MEKITDPQWARIGLRPHHGIALPLFSLRSETSCGIGEFLDLIPLIDWCKKAGFDVLQLLPLNHSEEEPSPYSCISSCALNASYLSLYALPLLEHCPELKNKLPGLRLLDQTDRVNHAEVARYKIDGLKIYAEQVGKQVLEEPDTKTFLANNPWLKSYALFRVLQTEQKGAPWHLWPPELTDPTSTRREHLYKSREKEISFHYLVQYLCFQQLKAVKEHARAAGLFLMGDIPILMNTESADVWEHVEYFDLNLAAGAPPDPYNSEGQNWGFPLFNWNALRKDQMRWWKQRLTYAESFFDLFRIDHVLGFFRFFAIPPHRSAKEGRYVPEDAAACEAQGVELLSCIASATQMLPIAEDLGTPLPCVKPTLENLGICGTKVMRWEREWGKTKRYTPLRDYPPLSLTCVSTHDSETLALWWKLYPEDARIFAAEKGWEYNAHLGRAEREHILRESHRSGSLFHINLLQEYLAYFPELVHSDPEDERINIPGTFSPKNWSYRCIPSVEEIASHPGLLSLVHRVLQ